MKLICQNPTLISLAQCYISSTKSELEITTYSRRELKIIAFKLSLTIICGPQVTVMSCGI